jgi:YVTN family beta-propeller protein
MSIRTVTALGMLCAALISSRAGATPFAYVGDGTNVDVIDTATNTIVATVPVGTTCSGVAVSPDGSHVYLTCNSSALHVIDTATNTATQSAAGTFTGTPSAVAVHPDGTRVYVVDGPQVRVIDTATLSVVASISDPSLGATTMAINPAGTRLYVGGGNNGVLIVMDLTTNSVVTEIGGLAFTYYTAITPDGAKVYTGRLQGYPIHVIDAATNTLTTNIPIPQGVAGLAINPAGTRLYSLAAGSSSLQVIDIATDTVLTSVPLVDGCGGIFPTGVAINPAGTRAYFYGNGGCDGVTMRVFDTATNTIVGSIPGTSLIPPEGLFIGPFCPGACSDGNPCTTDVCNPLAGCSYTNNTGPCASDGNPCTDDVCDGAGTCTHPLSVPGSSCDDGTFCNGPDTCDAVGGCTNHAGDPCVGGPACAHTCDEAAGNCFDPATTACASDGNVCTDDHCDGAGACVHTANTASCDDGLFCDGVDTCAGTVCTHAGDPCAGGPECANLCNEGAGNCFEPAGAACASDGNQCTLDQCNGTGACTHPARPDGTPCDDADACTSGDQCTAGVCAGPTTVVCDPCKTCTPAGGCELPTAPGCLAAIPGGSSILLRDGGLVPDKDLLNWKWKSSGSVALSDFGDPTTTTDLTVCVIDQAGLRLSATAPADGTCGTKPCWSVVPLKKLKYGDKDLTPDGVQKLQVKPGGPNVAKIVAKGKGANLGVPGLGLSGPVTVRLVRSGGPACWEATYGSHVLVNTSTMFKAKSD